MAIEFFSMVFAVLVSVVLIGYLLGFFVFVFGPMKPSDIRAILGPFFVCTILIFDVPYIITGEFTAFTKTLFSLSGHYVISTAILSFCLLVILTLYRILVDLFSSECFPIYTAGSIVIFDRVNEKGEHYDYFLSFCSFAFGDHLSLSGAEG